MHDFMKRMAVAIVMMAGIGILMVGTKVIHAEDTGDWMWPLEAKGFITSTFGARGGEHNGLDIAVPKGTPVVAAKSGVVKKSYFSRSYGNVIFILHNNGYETVYAHLSKRLVEEGDYVDQGQVIGEAGSTGHSTGSHLHFEVHQGLWNVSKTNAIDPMLVVGHHSRHETVRTLSGHLETYRHQLPAVHLEGQKKVAVTIEKGDTLWDLAHEYDVPVSSLKKWNGLSTDLLKVGDTIVIYPDKFETYEVQKGDSLRLISEKTGVGVSALTQYNNLGGETLFPGKILITAIHQ